MKTEVVRSKDWERKVAAMIRKENREFTEKRRLELSVEDLRDQLIGIIHETHGRGLDAYDKVHEAGGPHPSTLRAWDEKRVMRPQSPTMRAAARACGYDLQFVKIQ